jgi:hypothetical protein
LIRGNITHRNPAEGLPEEVGRQSTLLNAVCRRFSNTAQIGMFFTLILRILMPKPPKMPDNPANNGSNAGGHPGQIKLQSLNN